MNKLISAICSSLLLGVSLTTVHAQEFDRGIVLNTFIPKGQWVVGNSISYSEYSNDNYQFLVIENMDGIGYTFKVSPMFCYIVKDNLGLGGRFAYERSLTKLDNASIKIGDDLNFDMDNVYSLSHSYSGMAIMRNYISIGNSSRFGLFNELQLSLGGGESKMVNGSGESLTGTFERSFNFNIGIAPGLMAFLNDYTAIEVNVGLLGFNYSHVKQTTDQVYTGKRSQNQHLFFGFRYRFLFMKNLKYTLILIGILIPGQILLHAEVQDSTTVIPETATIVPRNTSVATSEPDTIAEKHGLSRKKYKRGLKNYLLIPQKQWIAGLTLSHGEFDSKDNNLLIFIKDFNFKGNITTLNPFVGYFIKDNECIGIKLGYSHLSANLDNLDIDIDDDMQFNLGDIRYLGETFSAALFHRAYIGIDKNKRFGFFNETELAFSSGSNRFVRGSDESLKNTKTTTSEIKLGLNPGFCVFIMNNISTSVSFGVAGLRYGTIKQTTNNEETGSRRSSGADFKINLFNINIGMCLHI